MGAGLLVFSNKTDVEGCMTADEIRTVNWPPGARVVRALLTAPGSAA